MSEPRGAGRGGGRLSRGEGGVNFVHATSNELHERVAEALREATGVADAVAEDVLDDVRVRALRRDLGHLEPQHRGLPDLGRVKEDLVEAVLGVVVEQKHRLAPHAGGTLKDGVVPHGGLKAGLALCGELTRTVAQARLEPDCVV